MTENSQNTEPLVSICIPVFNGEKTIRKTIDSLINQTYKNLEIIIVDNCSTDSTVEIVQEFEDSRIRIIQNDVHLPCGEYNWNRCFQYVYGDFMAIFHADDVYLPQMVSRQIEVFKKFPSASCIFTQGNFINERDEIIGEALISASVKGVSPYSYHELLPLVIEYGDFLICPSAMLRTDIYKKIAPFRYEQFGSASDFDMWLRASELGSIMILYDKLINIRISKTQGSFRINYLRTDEADWFKVLDYHILKNKEKYKFTSQSIDKYELKRLIDIMFILRNCIIIGDLQCFRTIIQNILWKKYLLILLIHPRLSINVYVDFFRCQWRLLHSSRKLTR